MRGFLDYFYNETTSRNITPSLKLITTWITNYEDEVLDIYAMPMLVNNVDLTVNANSMFGLNNVLL